MSTDDASAALSKVHSTILIVGTTGADGKDHFMLANWGTQASFDPWRYVLMLKTTSHTLENARRAGAFTVCLLDASRKDLAKAVMKGKDAGLAGVKGPMGAPRLEGALAGWDCRLLKVRDVGGDHALVVADVADGFVAGEGPALLLEDLRLSYAG